MVEEFRAKEYALDRQPTNELGHLLPYYSFICLTSVSAQRHISQNSLVYIKMKPETDFPTNFYLSRKRMVLRLSLK